MTLSADALNLIDTYQAGREGLSEVVLIDLARIARTLGPAFVQCSETVFHKTDLPVAMVQTFTGGPS